MGLFIIIALGVATGLLLFFQPVIVGIVIGGLVFIIVAVAIIGSIISLIVEIIVGFYTGLKWCFGFRRQQKHGHHSPEVSVRSD